jgi:hypothetical protein
MCRGYQHACQNDQGIGHPDYAKHVSVTTASDMNEWIAKIAVVEADVAPECKEAR